ncbi:hypothetical protein [Pseudothauera rhizosphaerae]|uniref:Uncharacterized protein n=1 Tax=Pseudothauera rhizosphaerae TaxID=2565932 RepID=A0A4S4AWB5_9RHOO|nr:hypothetical protein [Pseudothauera rhizosphaerae]THF64319.1 hypothetical protein E6O51_03135 [Pseudothauera rhizosphaerae]
MDQETMMTEAPTTTEGAASQEAAAAPEKGQQAAGEQQTQGEQQVQQPEAKPEQKEVAPEQYADFTFEEGAAPLDAEVAADIKATAKELGLSQEKAQKLADLAVKRTAAAQQQQVERLQQARTEWADTARADQEFGGEKLNENLAVARKALDAFGSPELKSLLNESGLGNHPEFIRLLYRTGKAISEDRIVTGGAPTGPKDAAKTLFPDMN